MSDSNPQQGSTIEDKLKDQISQIRAESLDMTLNEAIIKFTPKLQAIITTETKKERIDELLSADDTIRLHGVEAWQDYFTTRLKALQKEQKR